MNPAKKGLGRGLSALFGDIDNKSISNDKVSNTIPIADLSRNKYQPRTIFDDEKLSELSKSIKDESSKLVKSIAESNVMTSAKINQELDKMIKENKKNQNTKLLKELSNSTSSLNAALDAISSQNKLLVKEITTKNESITFP